jgi:hypothetical protein
MAAGTVTYRFPKSTEPAAADVDNEVVADVAMGASANDDDTDIVHNLGCAEADGSKGSPHVSVVLTAAGSSAKCPLVAFKDANTLTVKAGAKGANCDFTARVHITRPHSLVR